MNPYVIDLEKLNNRHGLYIYLRLILWFVTVYASVWLVIGSMMFISYKLGIIVIP